MNHPFDIGHEFFKILILGDIFHYDWQIHFFSNGCRSLNNRFRHTIVIWWLQYAVLQCTNYPLKLISSLLGPNKVSKNIYRWIIINPFHNEWKQIKTSLPANSRQNTHINRNTSMLISKLSKAKKRKIEKWSPTKSTYLSTIAAALIEAHTGQSHNEWLLILSFVHSMWNVRSHDQQFWLVPSTQHIQQNLS